MKRTSSIILIVLVLTSSMFFVSAYAVDNNCFTGIINIIQVRGSLECFEKRLDTIENKGAVYQLLCESSLSTGATSLSCSNFPTKNFLYIEYTVKLNSSNTVTIGLQFNSDSGTNYATRLSSNYGADAGGVSQSSVKLNGNAYVASASGTGYLHCDNVASKRKLCNGENTTDANSGATATVNYSAYSFKWANTSNQITTVTLMRNAGTGFYTSGTQISVWGYD